MVGVIALNGWRMGEIILIVWAQGSGLALDNGMLYYHEKMLWKYYVFKFVV